MASGAPQEGEPPESQKTDTGQPASDSARASDAVQSSVSHLNPESHMRSEIGSYAAESRETEENRGAVAGKGEIAFPGTQGLGFTHLPLVQVHASPFGGEMIPNLPREDRQLVRLIPQIWSRRVQSLICREKVC